MGATATTTIIPQGFPAGLASSCPSDPGAIAGQTGTTTSGSSSRSGRTLRSKSNPKRGFTSRFRGVHQTMPTGRWEAQFRRQGKPTSLGCFDTEEDAAHAYDRMMIWTYLHHPDPMRPLRINYDLSMYAVEVPRLTEMGQEALLTELRRTGRAQAEEAKRRKRGEDGRPRGRAAQGGQGRVRGQGQGQGGAAAEANANAEVEAKANAKPKANANANANANAKPKPKAGAGVGDAFDPPGMYEPHPTGIYGGASPHSPHPTTTEGLGLVTAVAGVGAGGGRTSKRMKTVGNNGSVHIGGKLDDDDDDDDDRHHPGVRTPVITTPATVEVGKVGKVGGGSGTTGGRRSALWGGGEELGSSPVLGTTERANAERTSSRKRTRVARG